jgi:hypothetical protein
MQHNANLSAILAAMRIRIDFNHGTTKQPIVHLRYEEGVCG